MVVVYVHHVSWSFLIPSVLSLVIGKLLSLWLPQYRFERRYFYIDIDKINVMKQEAIKNEQQKQSQQTQKNNNNPSVPLPFCSLNDIVTSWFFMNSQCHHGFMSVNVRDRMKGYTNQHAGNYVTCIYYHIVKHHASTPFFIRRSLQHMKRINPNTHQVETKEPPYLLTGGGVIATNWASVSRTKMSNHQNGIMIQLPGGTGTSTTIQQLTHYPLYTHQIKNHPANYVNIVIFEANPNQLGVLISGTPSKVNGFKNCPFELKNNNKSKSLLE